MNNQYNRIGEHSDGTPIPAQPTTKDRILVIDDDRPLASILDTTLREMGYDVDISYDGKDGFRRSNRYSYDLVSLDLRMPDWGGLDTIAAMSVVSEDLPILVVSGFLDAKTIENLELFDNVHGWLNKPIDLEVYIGRVREIIIKTRKKDHTS